MHFKDFAIFSVTFFFAANYNPLVLPYGHHKVICGASHQERRVVAAKKSKSRTKTTTTEVQKLDSSQVKGNDLLRKAKKNDELEGFFPHEWLAKVASGQVIKQRRLVIEYYKTGVKKGLEKSRTWLEEDYYPTFTERQDAAKAAAPYFAPRLAVQQTQLTPGTGSKTLAEIMKEVAEKLPN